MKILHIAYFGETENLNAIAHVLLELVKAQIKSKNSVKICTYSQKKIVDNNLVYKTENNAEFLKVVNNFKPDVAVFHSLYEIQQIGFSYILRKKRIPYIIVFHGGASIDNFRKGKLKKTIANLLFWNKIVASAKKVVYLSKNEEYKSIFKSVNNNSVIIPNGINVSDIKYTSKNNNVLKISFIGRLDYHGKGLDLLLNAINLLQNDGWSEKIHFAFYGGKYDETPEKIEKYYPFAKWYGFVSGKEKEAAYKSTDILILPSRSEGMPVCILEALSYGVPCIVTPETNMADIIRENGCGWVIALSVISIVNQIKKAYVDIKKDRLIYFNNCRNVAKDYSWDQIAQKTIDTYISVL